MMSCQPQYWTVARETRDMRDSLFEVLGSKFRKPQTSDLELSPVSFSYGPLRLIRQSIQDRLKLQTCGRQRLFIGVPRNPDGGAPQIETSGPWIRDHEPIPARKEFFFEQLKARGTIGSPVAFASCTTPSFATWRGPLGPSGVTTRSAPDRPRRISSRKASAPPLVLDPRTARCPNREMIRAMISPS
jgi:hypothetical protein